MKFAEVFLKYEIFLDPLESIILSIKYRGRLSVTNLVSTNSLTFKDSIDTEETEFVIVEEEL